MIVERPTIKKSKVSKNLPLKKSRVNIYNSVVLFYNRRENYFTTEDDYIVYDIFELLPPYVVEEFMECKEEVFVRDLIPGVTAEIYVTNGEDDDYYLNYIRNDFSYFDVR